MPAIVLADGQDDVISMTGNGHECRLPKNIKTGPATYTGVKINGHPPVLQGDLVEEHNKGGCVPDTSVLTTYSSKVFVNGKGVARIGDQYTSDNVITSGSSNVFIG
jgi:uncharacterized Zn-binding protein involved in type VI secretion